MSSNFLGANQVFKELKKELDLINRSNGRAYHIGNEVGMHSRYITGSSYIHIPELEETLEEASNLSTSARISAKSSTSKYETVSGYRDWLGIVKYLDTIGLKQAAIDLETEVRKKYDIYKRAIDSERGTKSLKTKDVEKIKDKYMPLFQEYFLKQEELGALIKPFELELKPGNLKIDVKYYLLSEIGGDHLANVETSISANFEPKPTVEIPANHPLIDGINDNISSIHYYFGGQQPFGDLIIQAERVMAKKADDAAKLTVSMKPDAVGNERIIEFSVKDLRDALKENEDEHTRFTIYVKHGAKINEEMLNEVKGILFL